VTFRTFEYFYCESCKLEIDTYGRRVKSVSYTPEEKHDILVMNGWKYEKDSFNGITKYFHPISKNYYSLREAWDEYKEERKWL
jgi:hypothetical protein